ncbi:hypothetical protein CQA63_08240 [Helicobacter marmotae]|uniref:Uncharacterized protein n=2 Tax=Helicobacter marmotae TaxID=152490 RepID=A0A3D8I1S6_9HELI|nr:hypothetical protein [Helicobacter marmotae]RDU59045.1 hypothetical protein CQA63_08240 [Helicobacter marmotae]
MSFSSGIYSHCDKIKSHEVPPLKASPLWGIYKGEGATSQFKPLPLIKKEKRELPATPLVCHSELSQESEESLLSAKDSLNESLKRQPLSYSEPSIKGEELLLKTPKGTTSDSDRDSSPAMQAQNDKLCYPQGKLLRHSERSEESLKESLVAKRDSSAFTKPQNDNKSQTSFSSEIYSHCDKIKSHEVPPLKASSGWGIYKGEGATSQFKPLPLIEKEKRELLANPLVCHSELSQESEESLLSTKNSLKESLENLPLCHHEPPIRGEELLSKTPKSTTSDSDRDSSPAMQAQNDKLCYPQGKLLRHSERSEESLKESLVAKRDSSLDSQAQNDKVIAFTSNSSSNSSLRTRYGKLTTFTRNPKSNSVPLKGQRYDKNDKLFTPMRISSCISTQYDKQNKLFSPLAKIPNIAQEVA